MPELAVTGTPGLFGKVPALGDFVSRRLPRPFIEQWDVWLQDAIACSREQLGEDWLANYLSAPIWRFVLSAGLCDKNATAGLLMPSVDRVGRYFPLALAVAVPGCANAAGLAASAAEWFEQAEEVMLLALEDGVDFEAFDRSVVELGAPAAPSAESAGSGRGGRGRLFAGAPAAVFAGLADEAFAASFRRYSLWWTGGAEDIEPAVLVAEGLPGMSGFAAFLDGDWARWGWSDEPGAGAAGAVRAGGP